MSKCSRCENLPAEPPEEGVLYVAPPLSHTRGTLRRLLWGSGLPFGDPLEDVLAVELCPSGLSSLSDTLLDGMTEAELRDCRAILVEKGARVDLGALSRMQDLFTLLNCAREAWLKKIMREEKLAVHFQPIVAVADPGEVFAYECLLRGIDEGGALVGPGSMFGAARAAGLLYNLDRAARVRAIEEAARQGIRQNVFVNFNATSVYDPAYCLRSTMEAVEGSGIPPGRIVFEVTDGEQIRDTVHLANIVDYYREGGFGVALDDLGSGYGSLDLLAELSPDFVKLDMGLVSRDGGAPYKASIARKLIELAHELGVIVIAEGVESPEQYRWISAHGVDYAQGHFFARPASPPPAPNRVGP
ncbi:EAL domain-containing protein [Rubrobacter marinus]|uniref:EAL domain-containing protein n=1 Tax=Rubrobacter marinus TaxID=2653852 RepID=A0A6G8Q265_9ACTN|nr:EAL domain-containing protein [Rubrobacter marinus]QIN80556.1 EAL domain-containing protein [Rubrobacter marinus]